MIELLVVIAIIAILASILMPALSSARERGRANVAWLDGHVDSNDHGSIRQKIPSLAQGAKIFIDTASYSYLK